MTELLGVARPYAKAVFAEAQAQKTLTIWESVLQVLDIAVQTPELSHLIKDPVIAGESVIAFLMDIVRRSVKDIHSDAQQQVENFLNCLWENKRIPVLPSVYKIFHELRLSQEKVVEVDIISAFSLSEGYKKKFKERLEIKLGSGISITYSQDESLIGGAIIRTDQWVMDGSAKGKLAKLK